MNDTRLLQSFFEQEKAAYLSVIASLASADYEASIVEVAFLQEVAHLADLSDSSTQQVLAAANDVTNGSIRQNLDWLKNSDLRFSLLTDLLIFARIDSVYSNAEVKVIHKIAWYLGINQDQLNALEHIVDQVSQTPFDVNDIKNRFLSSYDANRLSSLDIPEKALTDGLLGLIAPVAVSNKMGGLLGGGNDSDTKGLLGGLLGGGLLASLMGENSVGQDTTSQIKSKGLGSLMSVLGNLGGRPQPYLIDISNSSISIHSFPRDSNRDPRITRGKPSSGSSSTESTRSSGLSAGVPADNTGGVIDTTGSPIEEIVRGSDGASNDSQTADPVTAYTPAAEENRQLLVETQEQVYVADNFALTVQVVTGAVPAGPYEAVATIPKDFAGKLDIDIKVPRGLKLLTSSSQQLDVPTQGDSSRLRFLLLAAAPGTYTIRVDAWNGAAYLVSADVVVTVETTEETSLALVPPPISTDNKAYSNSSSTARSALVMRAPEADEYTLTVEFDAESRVHTFRLLRGNKPLEPMESKPLVGSREQILSGLNEVMNQLARNKLHYDYAQARDWLEGKGVQMFQQLLPKELQQVLWDIRHRMSRLNIIAPGSQMPWEMLFLMDPNPDQGSDEAGIFLADATVVVRWVYGDGPPDYIQRTPAYVVIPANSPPSAQQEKASVELVCGPPTLVSDLNGLRTLTRNGSFRWLHFASHNITLPGQFGSSYIPFGDSPFSQELMESIPAKRYAVDRPLVFMNACTTAGAQFLFTETSGWANTFLKRGAAAFVGSMWEVRDKSAAVFAQAFYQALKEGKNLGDALHDARKSLDPGDPTYLAYILYGNPRAILQ